MTDHAEEFEDDEPADEDESSVIREMRSNRKKLARENRELTKQLTRLQRDVAFRDSGLELNDAQKNAVLRHLGEGFEGLDGDAIREASEALAFVSPPQIPYEEQQAHERAREAANGAEAAEAHPMTFDERLEGARTQEEALALIRDAGLLEEHI